MTAPIVDFSAVIDTDNPLSLYVVCATQRDGRPMMPILFRDEQSAMIAAQGIANDATAHGVKANTVRVALDHVKVLNRLSA